MSASELQKVQSMELSKNRYFITLSLSLFSLLCISFIKDMLIEGWKAQALGKSDSTIRSNRKRKFNSSSVLDGYLDGIFQ